GWILGRRVPTGELLLRAGALLETAYDVAELAPLLAQLVHDSLGLRWVRITVLLDERTPQLGEIVGTAGAAGTAGSEPAGVLDLSHAGETLGRMEYGAKSRGVVTPEDEALLVGMARQAGLAIRNARLSADLAGKVEETRSQAAEIVASRARLVTAQDDERRRLERDLHDGAQQQIVAVMAKLRMVRNRLARAEVPEAPGVSELLAELQDDTRLLLDELRELAHGIRPPVLADRGLVEALETRAARLPLSVQIQADEAARTARYADDIEGCAWFAVNEAIANAIKHADAAAVVIAVDELDDRLLVVVADDGVGFAAADPTAVRRGRGLANLQDRVEALDGRLAVTSRPGAGTRISIELPAQRAVPAGSSMSR
ncbi:MAG: histidine kinase, partial [Actinomycetota bacterium]|nr:histidine kinase [Actinomycetota bacterium]